ncbi:MAG TPA: hypothetical protein VGB90_09660 [Alphaproteobacteria bacterium]|jgi:hypothetical protein
MWEILIAGAAGFIAGYLIGHRHGWRACLRGSYDLDRIRRHLCFRP